MHQRSAGDLKEPEVARQGRRRTVFVAQFRDLLVEVRDGRRKAVNDALRETRRDREPDATPRGARRRALKARGCAELKREHAGRIERETNRREQLGRKRKAEPTVRLVRQDTSLELRDRLLVARLVLARRLDLRLERLFPLLPRRIDLAVGPASLDSETRS